MNDALDKTLLKILKICVNVFVAAWTVIFIPFLFLCLFSENWCQYPVLSWPFIHTILICIPFYKFYKLLKSNDDSISKLQAKIWLMETSRNGYLSCLYLSIAAKYTLGMVLFFILTMATIYCLNYIKNVEN